MTDNELLSIISDHAAQIDNFLLGLNYCIQITLGVLLGTKLGER